ncbi:MAG: hypothetical protein R6U51_04160 [Anaerolineales bacterium]
MRKFNRMVWVITALGIYLLSLDTIPSPEAKFYAVLLAPVFALPLPITLSLLQKEMLRLR